MSEDSLSAPHTQHKPLDALDENLPIRAVYGVLRVGGPSLPIPQLANGTKPAADPSTYSPIQHTLYSLQTFGFTHPSHGRFLMVPKEFQAILILETKAVAAVIWEIMQQTIGWESGREPGGCREWAPLTVRYFERARILSRKHAEKGIARALAKGYMG